MDSPQNLFRIGALIVVAVMAAGCSFNVARLPAPAEFSKPMSVLVEEYPDLTRVFPEYSTSDRMGMAFADAFIAAWGEPYEKQLTWWNLWPGNWPFVPQYLWYWRLSGKPVACRIDHPFYESWMKTVCNCRVVDSV